MVLPEDTAEDVSSSYDALTDPAITSSGQSPDRNNESSRLVMLETSSSGVACSNCRTRKVRVSLISQSCQGAFKLSLIETDTIL
jgi:hypothetical protein